MKKIHVKLGRESYDILVCYNGIDKLGKLVKQLNIGRDAVIITNPVIKQLFGKEVKNSLLSADFNVRFELVPDSEKAKSEKFCIRLLNNISKFDSSTRRVFIVALGGGVVGDIAGFVASIYRRGVPYIQVPTTLLAQVDSAIGGKVAIDLELGKNLAGSFYQPRFVFSDTALIKTLPIGHLRAGLAEVIKYGIIKSAPLFNFLEKDYNKLHLCDKKTLEYIVHTCSAIKAKVIEEDVHDKKNIRVILNLGHTIGHAIEAASEYSRVYSHGQAVALGIISASYISKELDIMPEAEYFKIRGLIKKIGLPVTLRGINGQDIISLLEHDKKFIHGKNRFVLPVKIGHAIVKEGIPESLVREAVFVLLR